MHYLKPEYFPEHEDIRRKHEGRHGKTQIQIPMDVFPRRKLERERIHGDFPHEAPRRPAAPNTNPRTFHQAHRQANVQDVSEHIENPGPPSTRGSQRRASPHFDTGNVTSSGSHPSCVSIRSHHTARQSDAASRRGSRRGQALGAGILGMPDLGVDLTK